MKKIECKTVNNLAEFIGALTKIVLAPGEKSERYFRGESKDRGATAFQPSIYRQPEHLENEPDFYREMQRFNDQEFQDDKTTVDKLSRMQHYMAPTRLVDMSEDALSALYFAVEADRTQHNKLDESEEKSKERQSAVVYVIDVLTKDISYYDSDTVSVVANLAKSPLSLAHSESNQKNKQAIASDALKYRDDISKFNEQESIKFLLHDIKEEKPYFSNIINPKHIFSVQCVKPKFTHSRVNSQKGAFLLFGLNPDNVRNSIALVEKHGEDCYLSLNDAIQNPVVQITKIIIPQDAIEKMRAELKSVGVRTPFIYPEMDKIAQYLKVN